LDDGRTGRGDGVAPCRERKAKIGFVDPHQRLAGIDLLPDIDKPLDDLAGDAETEIALHPGRDDAGEAAFRAGDRRCRRQPDDRGFLPRVAHGRGSLRADGQRGECRGRRRREQDAPHHHYGSQLRAHRLPNNLDCVRHLCLI
jgi:hypothetical protein